MTTEIGANRKAALAKGLLFYLGRECKRGHLGVRYASCAMCVDCHAKVYQPDWNQKNPLRRREFTREYYYSHHEEQKARCRKTQQERRDKNKDAINARRRKNK